MNQLIQEQRRAYAAQRAISQGAGITLLSVSGGYRARFECATRCVEILGNRGLTHYDESPDFVIPLEDMHTAIAALTQKYSVALVDTITDESGTRFVLIWKTPAAQSAQSAQSAHPAPTNLDEF